MSVLLGIDVGTSSIKAMLLDSEKGVLKTAAQPYDVSIPEPGFGEQDPQIWWNGLLNCLKQLKSQHEAAFAKVEAIGFSGQMHGLVMADHEERPVRPAILWMDQRSQEECREITEKLGEGQAAKRFHNRIFPGFSLPSLLWVKKHEPENLAKTAYVMQPKDYVRMKLTGQAGLEVSDASAGLFLNVRERTLAKEVLETLGISSNLLPDCAESMEIQGTLTEEAANLTGLPRQAKVIYGMGDQPAQSIGNGAVSEGSVICNIGTGAQISAFSKNDAYDEKLRTHTFCHGIPGGYTIFGAILNGGMALKWLKNQILCVDSFAEISKMAAEAASGSEGLVFLPYLTGERTPHMDASATGMFFGLNLSHDRRHMARAVMEGVTFALKDCLEILEEMDICTSRLIASGGGASSPVWLQMQADIFEKEILVCTVEEQACLGACLAAGTAAGVWKTIEEACQVHVKMGETVYVPNPQAASVYRKQYEIYRKLYAANRELMKKN